MVVRISDKTQNYSKVTKLLVKPNNKPMQNFMIRHGFKHVGTIYLKNGQSRLAFHCNLNEN